MMDSIKTLAELVIALKPKMQIMAAFVALTGILFVYFATIKDVREGLSEVRADGRSYTDMRYAELSRQLEQRDSEFTRNQAIMIRRLEVVDRRTYELNGKRGIPPEPKDSDI